MFLPLETYHLETAAPTWFKTDWRHDSSPSFRWFSGSFSMTKALQKRNLVLFVLPHKRNLGKGWSVPLFNKINIWAVI